MKPKILISLLAFTCYILIGVCSYFWELQFSTILTPCYLTESYQELVEFSRQHPGQKVAGVDDPTYLCTEGGSSVAYSKKLEQNFNLFNFLFYSFFWLPINTFKYFILLGRPN
jgi:hypothetical protein